MDIAKRNQRNLLALVRKHEVEAIAKTRLVMQPEQEVGGISPFLRGVPFCGMRPHKAMEPPRGYCALKDENVERRQSLVARTGHSMAWRSFYPCLLGVSRRRRT